MKALHLNLAAHPYRDYRPVYAVVVVASLLIAFLMLNNVDTYYRYVRDTRTTRARIAEVEREAAGERARAQSTESQLRGVNLAALDRQTRFINARLAERAFSWSELLDRLEDVLPGDVRVTAISPNFTETGQVHLELSCEAKTGRGMIDTLDRLTADPHFSNPFPHSEQARDSSYAFSVEVDYKPSVARLVVAQ
ncbi:MAG TPA: hypothetical protein VNL91_09310 [Thermoanaerobaculia bacterium]|nr:hypothetical protein [Thermoanaerobaculia bacterium]